MLAAPSLACTSGSAIPVHFEEAARLCAADAAMAAAWDAERPPALPSILPPDGPAVLAVALPGAAAPATVRPRMRFAGAAPQRAADGLRWVGRAGGHEGAILDAALRHRVDPALLASLVRVESGFRTDAVSPKGALGLTQVMPATARDLGIAEPRRLLDDPALALDAGARYLRWLRARLGGDVALVLAGYNAGPGAVRRHGGIPPYGETRAYVRRVLADYDARRREDSRHWVAN